MDQDNLIIVSEPCPYLPGKTATAEVLQTSKGLDHYEELIPQGWRRSGSILYRYRCEGCFRCIPIRIPASQIDGGKRLSRLLNLNSDLSLNLLPSRFNLEHFRLYEKYIRARHPETEFSDEVGYRDMIDSPLTAITEYRDTGGKLCGAGIVDVLPMGLSSVYFIFDPDEGRRSLGYYSVYLESALALSMGKTYYYMGFWVPGAPKMDYKADFQPFHLAVGRGSSPWMEFHDKTHALDWLSTSSQR
ncbi:MAG: arginyltransferase [Spirochaetae bacterium HGW-Spirochaetae-9]|nr:MAG: arginyltransferase [Spirochaetae bacterium HGW-Spirochaetae-9]